MNESALTRFVTIVTDPRGTMIAVRENPRWPAAMLAIVVMMGLYAGMTIHITGPEQVDMMQETRWGELMSAEDIDEMYARYDDVQAKDRLINGGQAGFGMVVVIFIAAAVYHLFAKLAGGAGSFKQTLGVIAWSSVISLGLSSLVKLPLVLARGASMDLAIGPAVLVADRGPLDATFQLLSMFDVFSIWAVVLVVFGYECVHGFTRNKAMTVAVSVFLLMNFVMFGIGQAVT